MIDLAEFEERIELTLRITLQDVRECDAQGHIRTITTRLNRPVGDRTILDGYGH